MKVGDLIFEYKGGLVNDIGIVLEPSDAIFLDNTAFEMYWIISETSHPWQGKLPLKLENVLWTLEEI